MLRLALVLLAFLMPSLAWAQKDGEPITITGIVRDHGSVAFPYGDRDYHSQAVRLAAWREGDGPVQTLQLWVTFRAATYEELQAIEKQFAAGQEVRFETSGAVNFRNRNGAPVSADVNWARMLEPVADSEVLAAADATLNPEPFEDPELGTFLPHSSIPEYFGQMREWLGQETTFEVILEPLGPNAREAAMAMARMAWNEREEIDAAIRAAVTEGVYGERAEELQVAIVTPEGETAAPPEEEGPKLTRAQFQTDHKLERVSCSAQGYCDYQYTVQNDEWYWSYRATIMLREDGSWYVDGWEFP